MKQLALLALSILALLSAIPAFAGTYYVDNSGSPSCSDTAAGTTTAPWCHAPGMSDWTGSHNPVAGDRFILRGGDTWTSSDMGMHLQWSGSSGNPIYWGVDATYYTGGSWVRPKINCGNTACGADALGEVVYFDGSYMTLDNIEITGYTSDANQSNVIVVNGNSDTIEHMYIHGWSHAAGTCTSGNDPYVISTYTGGPNLTGDLYANNVIDGSDSGDIGGSYCFGGILHGNTIENNVIRYVYNGMNGAFDKIDGNLVEYNNTSTTGDHCNLVFMQDLYVATTGYVYNNIIRHSGCSGGSTLWLLGNDNCTNCTVYAYNNLIYDVGSDFSPTCIVIGNHPGNSGGPFYLYNNTCEAGGAAAFGNGESPQRFVTTTENNHVINASAVCDTTGTTCSYTTNLSQTTAQADANTSPHFDQYTASETYPYSPVASTNSTVGAGTDLSGSCSGGLAALCSDTAYATYNTTNHTVALRSVTPRGSTFDIGAYQFGGSNGPPRVTTLTGSVTTQ